MKKASLVLFILMAAISCYAQGPTGAGTHTPIIGAHKHKFHAKSPKMAKISKKHSDRRMASR
jgi:hypothetical protein